MCFPLQRFFGFIEAVADSVEGLTSDLGEKTYETKTRGTRTVAAARAVGEGTYAILNRGGTGAGAGRTNLVMKLEVPATPGEVQEDFSIPAEGSYAFSVKNPSNEPGPGAAAIGLQEKADFPEEKKKEFGGYAWIGVTDPSVSWRHGMRFVTFRILSLKLFRGILVHLPFFGRADIVDSI